MMETFANDDDSGKVGKVYHCGVDKILLFGDAFFIFTLNIIYSCVAFFMPHVDHLIYKLQHHSIEIIVAIFYPLVHCEFSFYILMTHVDHIIYKLHHDICLEVKHINCTMTLLMFMNL